MDKYTAPQIEKILENMAVYIDTREQNTPKLQERIRGIDLPCTRKALSYGDYTAYFKDIDGCTQSLEKIVAIERKQNLTEICTNFTSGRNRFKKEFERAAADGCHMHVIIENDNYEKLYAHKYRSKLHPQSLIASLQSWSIRYGFQTHYCKSETTGQLIRDILHYELREYLLNQQIMEPPQKVSNE